MTTQKTRTRKAKAETAKAEEFIEEAKATSKRKAWPCTAEQISAERDGEGRSWRQVAINLGLGSPSRARRAYTDLTGRPHYESGQVTNRAPRGTVGKVESLQWDDDTDQDEMEAKLNGRWVEESEKVPAHWSGSTITVRRSQGTYAFEEVVEVKRVLEFSYGRKQDQPLHVFVIDRYTGGTRCFRVAEITQVR